LGRLYFASFAVSLLGAKRFSWFDAHSAARRRPTGEQHNQQECGEDSGQDERVCRLDGEKEGG
jgi:hypothetical protein